MGFLIFYDYGNGFEFGKFDERLDALEVAEREVADLTCGNIDVCAVPVDQALAAPRMVVALIALEPYLSDRNDAKNTAAENEGRASAWDVASIKAREALHEATSGLLPRRRCTCGSPHKDAKPTHHAPGCAAVREVSNAS